MTSIYSARWLLPISSAAIEGGAVAVEGPQIAGVGSKTELLSRFPESQLNDFGEAVILPGLVNTHSHLELTVMRGFLEREERDFFAWLKKLTLARLAMTPEDLFVSAACGAIEAARAGITFLGDSSSSAAQSMQAVREAGLRSITFQESFGPDAKLAGENFEQLRDQLAALRGLETDLIRAGVSPHAPYTVSAPQLELISRLAIDEKLPLMMHAAESQAEKLFMLEGAGPFADGLRSRGIEWQTPGVSTIEHLERHGILETRPLLAHCVTVDEDDIRKIAARGAGVAHCPKSNAKLGHGRAPFAKLIEASVNVGLGSDSAASNNECDLLEEARFAALMAPSDSLLSATDVLFAATLGGARALHLDDQIGALAEGMQADFIAVALDGAHQQPAHDPADALVFASSGRDVRLTVVAGKEVYRDGSLIGVDEAELLARLQTIRQKIDSISR